MSELTKVVEELKASKKENIAEAMKQFKDENAKAEIEFAKKQLRIASDEVDYFDREIAKLQEKKKPYVEMLKQFK